MRKIFIIFLSILVSINLCTFISYADASSVITYELSSDLSDAEKAELSSYDTLTKMINDIYSFEREKGDASMNDTGSLLYDLINISIDKFDELSKTTTYRYVQGLALLFLMIFFYIKLYDDTSLGVEKEFLTKEFVRNCMLFIIALIIIITLKYFVIFLLSFFRFLMMKVLTLKENNDFGVIEEVGRIVNPERIAYRILQESGLVGGSSLIEEVSIRSKEASLRSMYMFPWMVNWVGKLGELIIAFVNSILLLVYSMFFSISIADIVFDIKNSKFLIYGKYLTSIVLEELVIVVTICISEIILNPYIITLLTNIASGTSNLSFVNMAIIITAINFSKFIVLCFTFMLSRKLVGVV